jgi:ubiquinone/menaquinone biosynthesis C-methylase UbiE
VRNTIEQNQVRPMITKTKAYNVGQEWAGVRAEFLHGSASNMPLESEKFDFLFCRAAFTNFSEPMCALHAMQRVLKGPAAAPSLFGVRATTRWGYYRPSS